MNFSIPPIPLALVCVAAVVSTFLVAMVLPSPLSGVPLAWVGLSYGVIPATLCVGLIFTLQTLIFSAQPALQFSLVIYAPIVLLVWLALQSRRIPTEYDDIQIAYEFSPFSRLLAAAYALAGALCLLLFVSFAGTDGNFPAIFAKAIADDPDMVQALQTIYSTTNLQDVQTIADRVLLVGLVSWPLLLLANVGLGQIIAYRLGQNLRPSPSLAFYRLELPVWLAIATAISLLCGLFLTDWLGLFFQIMAGLCISAYFLLGLAVIHAISHHWKNRFLLLGGFYLLLLASWWLLAPLISFLGLLDTRFNFRRLPNRA